LQFTLKDQLSASLEEVQEVACQIEENLRFKNSIHQVNLLNDNDIWEQNGESMVEPKHNLLEILEVEYSAFPRKWSTCFSNIKDASLFSQQNEPPEDLKPTQDTSRNPEVEYFEYSLPQIHEEDNLEEEFPVVYQVGSMGTKYGKPAPFYVTLQINNFLLHNCVFDPDTPRNIITKRVMH
jgi:hypothetical protein